MTDEELRLVVATLDRTEEQLRNMTSVVQDIRRQLLKANRVKSPTELGEAVAEFLIDSGWSQRQLSQKAGVPQATISRVINGRGVSERTEVALRQAMVDWGTG